MFFGYAFNFMQKVEMGTAIVCMTNNTAEKLLYEQNNFKESTNFSSKVSASCQASFTLKKQTHVRSNDKFALKLGIRFLLTKNSLTKDGEFIWQQKTKGLILSAYFYGYIFMQVSIFFTLTRNGHVVEKLPITLNITAKIQEV